MLSPAVEDYLKTIYKLQGEGAASTSDVAQALSIAPASVTNMAKRLSEMGLAEHEPYKGVRLTEAGTKVALEILRHHRLLELYLKEVMGYSWEHLHEEAEHLEHHISEAFETRMEEMLGYPTRDPHGHPIPTREGVVAELATDTLAQASTGATVLIHHVSDGDPELLSYLEELGLLPGVLVEIVEKQPFNGPLAIRVGDARQLVGHEVACNVFVTPADG